MNIAFSTPEFYTWGNFSLNNLRDRRFVVFDLEATGPEFSTDSVIQFGAVIVHGATPRDEESFSSFVEPWKPIPPEIETLTGITNEQVSDSQEFKDAYTKFREFCGDAILVTQCGYEFDFPILDKECERSGLPKMENTRLDTKAIFAYLHRELDEIFSTNFLSDYYQIDRTPFKRHDALGDARLISRILCGELQEAKRLGVDTITVSKPLLIKRFVLPALPKSKL